MSSAGLSIGELVGTISLNDQLSGPLDKVAKAVGISSESLTAIAGAAGIATGALVSATGAVVALGLHGSDVADVQAGFEQVTAAVGETSDAMLGALQRGTMNTISNFELMKLANSAMGSGLITSASDMETLAAGAKLLSGRVGGDTARAFDILTDSIAKGKPNALKQLGIFVDTDDALQRYATSIGKTVPALSDHERATALSQASLAAMRAELDGAGPAQASFSDRINQGKVAIQNLVDNVAVAVANSPALALVMETVSGAIQDAFGGNNQQAVQTITEYVNKFAIFLVQAAQVGVEAVRFLSNAWDGLRVLFNVVVGETVSGLGRYAASLATSLELAAAIPGIGEKFKPMATAVRDTATDLEHLAGGFRAQAEAAVDSAADTNLALDKVQGTLATLEEKLGAVQGAQVQVATTAQAAAKAHGDAAGEAKHYAEVMNGLSEDSEAWRQAVTGIYDDVRTKFTTLMNDITTANMTKDEAQMASLAFNEQAELASLALRQESYGVYYEGLVALTVEKYRVMTEAAQGHYENVAKEAEEAGFRTRESMEQDVAKALSTYDRMLASGRFTTGELKKAWEAYLKARDQLEGTTHVTALARFGEIASAASSILRSIFGKSKAAAIAAVIIDVAAGVIKSFAQYGWPWGLAPAAAITAQGFAAISKINSTDGSFEQGTPGTSFVDFGRESVIAVHGPEAVINQAQGATLGEMLSTMVRDAAEAGQAEVVAELRRQGEAAETREKLLPYRLISAAALARG